MTISFHNFVSASVKHVRPSLYSDIHVRHLNYILSQIQGVTTPPRVTQIQYSLRVTEGLA
jgi:hypothetical protein